MSNIKIIHGNVIEAAKRVADGSVHMIVTSPPYYGLRDYGLPPHVWGGKPKCRHAWGDEIPGSKRGGSGTPTDKNGRGENYGRSVARGNYCVHCGAWRGCLGLEPTPTMFIENMVDVMREAWRVLRNDGTLWVNIGDSYYNYRPGNNDDARATGINRSGGFGSNARDIPKKTGKRANKLPGLKEKDLIGIPHMLAFAMRDAGWYFRDEVIWKKPNIMPSSVKDRCTRQHEYIFMFAKRKKYFYDNVAIEELASGNTHSHGRNPTPTGWDKSEGGHRKMKGRYKNKPTPDVDVPSPTRIKRSVWTMTTKGYSGKHFATFCEELPETAILAGTSAKGVCSACGAPWQRVVVKGDKLTAWQRACGANALGEYVGKATKDYEAGLAQDPSAVKARILEGMREKKTVGWEPTCKCGVAVTVPAVVLDLFGGAMTTALVASRLQRDAVALELSGTYIQDGIRRLRDDSPLLNIIELEKV